MSKSFITFSDVHNGAKPHDQMHTEFYAEGGLFSVLDTFLEDKDFIGVALTGDYWDCKLSLNDPKSRVGMSILVDLFNRCRDHDKHFVIIRGTYSHDLQQLDCMKEFEASHEKFRLINRAEVIDFGGLKTLCIPEEYPQDAEEYYSAFYEEKYDLILGHGFFDANCFDANEAEKSIPQMPIFEVERVSAMAPLTIFGHDHTHKSFVGSSGGRIYYNGSYSRLCHGEEGPKGFLYVNYKAKKSEIIFCENELAPKYVTVVLDRILKKSAGITFESIVKTVEAYKVKHAIDDLKVKMSPEFVALYRGEVELARNYFTNKSGFRFETGRLSLRKSNDDVVAAHDGVAGDSESIEDTRFGFLFGNEDIVTKLLKFITIKHDGKVDLSRESITKLLVP